MKGKFAGGTTVTLFSCGTPQRHVNPHKPLGSVAVEEEWHAAGVFLYHIPVYQ